MKICDVRDGAFLSYGRVLEGYDVSEMLKVMEEKTPVPEGRVIYEPSLKEMEELEAAEAFQEKGFGGLPIQIGYCNGDNHMLNALEYHRSSEIDVAVTDLVLLVGRQQDIEPDHTYDTSKVQAFLVPAGTVVELYATTLHYAPCGAEGKGFRCVIILPRDTNTELGRKPEETGEDRLMTAKNKWLLAHEEAGIEGAFCGLRGENLSVLN